MKLAYGNTFIDFTLPPQINWQILQKETAVTTAPEAEIVAAGVQALAEQLTGRITKNSKVLLIVPDHTRKCNLPVILPGLLELLQNEFQAKVEILVANGSHVLQPEAVIVDLVTPDIYARVPTFQHNSLDENQLADFGRTSFGTEIRLNKKVKEADFVIPVGGILYHYFAGFGGGPKMLFPGVAAYESIRQNHSRTIAENGRFHPHAQNGDVLANPVYRDLAEVVSLAPNSLSLQVVLSPAGKIAFCGAGPIIETQQKLIPQVRELYSLPVADKADVVVASAGGFPSDVNLIQSHKSIHHAFQLVKENGALIVCAECREGVGSKTFMPYFEHGSAAAIGQVLLQDFKINGQTALTLKEKTEAVALYLVSRLEKELVEKTGIIPCQSMEEALAKAASHFSPNKKGYILPKANMNVPIVSA